MITNDGVTIAKEIEFEDAFENMGAQLVKEVATKTNDVAGDGTTTATLLAQIIIREGFKNVAAGANPMVLKRGIKGAVDVAVDEIQKIAHKIETKDNIAQVASVSASGRRNRTAHRGSYGQGRQGRRYHRRRVQIHGNRPRGRGRYAV